MDKIDLVGSCNGEIRLMKARYQSGWYCIILIQEAGCDWFWDKWEDLVGGDNDYFEAREYFFGSAKGDWIIRLKPTPIEAINECIGALNLSDFFNA